MDKWDFKQYPFCYDLTFMSKIYIEFRLIVSFWVAVFSPIQFDKVSNVYWYFKRNPSFFEKDSSVYLKLEKTRQEPRKFVFIFIKCIALRCLTGMLE